MEKSLGFFSKRGFSVEVLAALADSALPLVAMAGAGATFFEA
jgi:hypothetical protein